MPLSDPIDQFRWRLLLAGTLTLPITAIFLLPCWGIALIRHLFLERPNAQHQALRYLGGVSLGLILTALVGYRPLDSLLGLFNYLPFFLFFWLITRLVTDEQRALALLRAMLLGALLTGTAGVIEWLSGQNWQWKIFGFLEITVGSQADDGIWDRVTSFFFWPTTAAAYFILVAPLGLAFAASHGALLGRWLGGLSSVMTLTALVGTASRNAWGAVVLALGILLVYARRWLVIGLLGVGVILVLAAALLPEPWGDPVRALVPEFLWRKVLDTLNPGNKAFESTAERLESWQIAWQMALAHPLTGWGLQMFPFVSVDLYGKQAPTIHAHNLYLHYWAEQGFVVGTALVGFYGWTIAKALKALPRSSPHLRWALVGLISGLIGYLCFGLFDVAFHDSRINAQFWLSLALTWRITELAKFTAPGSDEPSGLL